MGRVIEVLVAAMLASLAGCQHIGPGTIVDDRLPYNDAIAQSGKQQMLLNIVRTRYAEPIEFVDVPSIVSGYTLEHRSTGLASFFGFPDSSPDTNFGLSLGHQRAMQDRPTISYQPQTGSTFTRNLSNPISPTLILYLIESGHPADVVFELAVESINGLRNRQYFAGQVIPADPQFITVMTTLRKAQASGHVSMRIKQSKDGKEADLVLMIRDPEIDGELVEELNHLRKILNLSKDRKELRVVFGTLPENDGELAIRTRSVYRIITYLAIHVEVPPVHLAEGRAVNVPFDPVARPPLTIHSGCTKPCDSYASVCFQGHWFWIDHNDLISKRSMIYLKTLFALADTTSKDAPPILTIQAN